MSPASGHPGRYREHLARHYLIHSAITTGEIAYLLAYDDTNSFYRAFRTWTGTTQTPPGPSPPLRGRPVDSVKSV